MEMVEHNNKKKRLKAKPVIALTGLTLLAVILAVLYWQAAPKAESNQSSKKEGVDSVSKPEDSTPKDPSKKADQTHHVVSSLIEENDYPGAINELSKLRQYYLSIGDVSSASTIESSIKQLKDVESQENETKDTNNLVYGE